MPVKILNDRHGRQLELGQHVIVQQCIGAYGQTQRVKGVLRQLDPTYQGAVLELTEPATRHLRDHNEHVPAGKLFRVSLPGRFSAADDSWTCYKVHDDFEHGHEAWVEIVN